MSKRPPKRRQPPPGRRTDVAESTGPNPKAPCPCGSGRRFKACHGGGYAPINDRPFAGVPAECDWIALRELVPSATSTLSLADPAYVDRDVTLATVLPMASPAMVRADGRIVVAAQTNIPTPDPGRDIAHALLRALGAEPGAMQDYEVAPYDGPTLAEVLGPDPISVQVHEDFAFWLDGVDGSAPEVAASLERANETVFPTKRMSSVDAAYWCLPGDKAHLRWVMPHPEDRLLDALARLSAAGELSLGAETRFAGSFRAQGLLAPVWDLPPEAHADEWEQPAAAMAGRIEAALAVQEPLDESERRARAGLIGRQITLR